MSLVLGKRTVTRSVSLGSLQTKAPKMSISAQSDSDTTESKRVYTLDRGKALDKKLERCDAQHIVFEMKPGKNFVIRLSTSAYELAKCEIKNILQSPDLIGQYGIQTQLGLDCSDANIDTCLRVYNRRQNGAVGNIAKLTINFYHTTNTVTVNGSRVDVFINSIFDKLCDSIRSKHPQFDIANATIANQLNSLKSLSKSNVVQGVIDCTLPNGESALQIEYQTRNDNQSDEINTNNDDSVIEELAFCPYCEQEVTVEGIYCVGCESWLHYECVNLNPETVSDTFKDTEYVCDQCNEDTLYGDSQPNTQDHVSEQDGNDATTDRDTSPDSQATGVSNEWSKPSAMSVTGTTQKTCHLSSIPNPSPSKSQADIHVISQGENTITVDKDPNPLEVSPAGISQTTYATHENQVKSKEPPVGLTVINPSQSPKPRRPLHRKPNKADKGRSDVSSPNDVAIILAQKTKILDLENEIKQLKNAFESVKSHLSQGGALA